MSDPKIFKYLQELTTQELIGFQNYLTLPFIKNGQSLQALLEQLLILLKENKLSEDWKIKIGTILYPSATDLAGKMYNQLSALKNQIEQYLITLFFQKNPLASKKVLPEVLYRRKSTVLYSDIVKEQKSQLTKETAKDFHYYQRLFDLYHRQHINPNLPAFSQADADAETVMDSLDGFYVLTKLRYSAELYSKKSTLNKGATIHLLNAVQQLASSTWGASNPLFYLYNQLLIYYQQSSHTGNFDTFIDFVDQQISLLQKEEQIFIFYKLLNLANSRKQQKRIGFEATLSRLYAVGKARNLLLQDDVLNDTLLVNIIINKANLKAYEEATNFIDTFADKVPIATRSAAVLLSKGYICFCQKYFQKAIDYITTISPPDHTYYIRKNILLIICYVDINRHQEVSIYQELDKLISKFQRYLNRPENKEKIRPDRILSYKHFIKIVKVIRKNTVGWRIDEETRKRLLTKLDKVPSVVSYDWLKQKIIEL